MQQHTASKQHRTLILVLFSVGLIRLLSLGVYPLADTTEARYAEIARLMASSGNWITPQIDIGVPFWGKPPLSTWLSALSFNILGVNEFAARLPSFLLAVLIIGLVYGWANQLKGNTYALSAAVVLATSAVFFISSGAVMTDPALMLGTTLSMVAFYRAMNQTPSSHRIWGYWFFVGLAISLLAKGPVGLVLTLVPIGGWVLLQGCLDETWQRLPWIKGILLTVVLSIPWYLLAEKQTPGFLEYFLVGEHWKRFVDAGWEGDLYGRAHSRPRGTIWFYWLASALPWSIIAIGYIFSPGWRRQAIFDLKKKPALTSYLLLWVLTPMLFFTLAGNILWTYVLPGMPAFAMLIAQLWNQSTNPSGKPLHNRSLVFSRVAIGITLVFSVALLVMTSNLVPKRKCQKELVEIYENLRGPKDQLAYLYRRPHSAQFYSHGEAILIEELQKTGELFQNEQLDFFAIKKNHFSRIPDHYANRVEILSEYNGYYLLRELQSESSRNLSGKDPEAQSFTPGELIQKSSISAILTTVYHE